MRAVTIGGGASGSALAILLARERAEATLYEGRVPALIRTPREAIRPPALM